jgi:thiol-disulfide isomerase/thioredoxin
MFKRILLAALLAGSLFSQALFSQSPETAKKRNDMPDFKAKSIDGEVLNKFAVRGRPVLLQFWATWCGYCRKDEPVIEKLRKEYSEADLLIVAVNVAEERETVKKYLAEHKRSVKIVYSQDTDLPEMVQPNGFPMYVLLDAEGKIAGVQRGSGGEPSLREMLEVLNEKK